MIALFAIAVSSQAQPQPREAGRFLTQTFSPKDYGEDAYVWYAAQGNGGLMYFANLNGVLEFDGRTWRTIPVGGTVVRSVAADSSGTIFVGSNGDLGFLRPDSIGRLEFVSLRSRIPAQDRIFKDVWQLVSTGRGMYFNTHTRIFRWSREEGMHVWRGLFHKAFAVRDTVYVRDGDHGLARLDERGVTPIPGGERFRDVAVTAMLPFDEHRILLATHVGDLYLYDGKTFSPFVTEAEDFLRTHRPYYYAFAKLPGGTFALGTRDGGVVLLDRDGRVIRIADRTTGLRSNRVYFIHADHQGGLWLTHEDGITRWEAGSSFSYFGESSGLEGNVEAILRHDGSLFAATSAGVYVLRPSIEPGRPAGFVKLVDGGDQCWDLESVGARLLVACTNGVYEIAGETMVRVLAGESPVFALHASAHDSGLVYVGLKEGLTRLRSVDGVWMEEDRLDVGGMEVRSMVEEPDGRIWIGGGHAAMLIDPGDPADPVIRRFGQDDGLSRGYVTVARVRDQIILLAENGLWLVSDRADIIYRISAATAGPSGRIQTDAPRNAAVFSILASAATNRQVSGLREDGGGSIWLRTSRGPEILRIDRTGGFTTHSLNVLEEWGAATIYPDRSGVVWFGGTEGIARYDPHDTGQSDEPFSAFVRRVATIRSDSLLFAGARRASMARPTLGYAENSVRFSVGAASFNRRPGRPLAQRFQYLLDGFDTTWSSWTEEFHRDYTNLSEGDYRFRVRARDTRGRLGREAAFSFTILPPWYRTWWAYSVYTLFGIGLITGTTRRRMARLERLNRTLETQVEERSARLLIQKEELETINRRLAEHERELESRNKMLERQAEQLRALDAVKSRFFANISHEFRTPLTLILGPLEDALSDTQDPSTDNISGRLEPMYRNAQRLLGLINQLLDLARLESGKMAMHARRMDLVPFLKNIVAAFESRAMRKDIKLSFDGPEDAIMVYADAEKLERVVVNLVANAFKFTPKGGLIDVRCMVETSPSPTAAIFIDDSGSGIPPADLERIFERFYTADTTLTRRHEGTGIGLALARELVDLHGGTIDVDSEVGSGSTFAVRLPLGSAHLDPGDVIHSEPDGEHVVAERRTSFDGADFKLANALVSPVETSSKSAELPTPDQSDSEKRACVLIVEDNPDLRVYLRSHLESNYRVEEAMDGKEGLEMAKAKRPDLVISDVMMPRMDGYALCEAIKSDADINHIPVVLLTARASDEDRVDGLAIGADDYLFKPFNKEELLVRVENLIEIRRLLRRRFGKEVVAVEASEMEIVPEDKAFLDGATNIAEAHVRNSNFGVDWLADELGMSVRQLQRRIKDLTGLTPSGFIRTIRLQRAAQLIERGAGNVSEIAADVGFSDPKYFSKQFRQVFGTTPSQYRQNGS